MSVNDIAKWDGAAWSPLDSSMNGCRVEALVVDGAGNLYAAGHFTTSGGADASHVAKWDGTAWSALGSGIGHWVDALALDDTGNLYAGGYFTAAGGVSANYIAKWDGASWSPLGDGMNDGVVALVVDGAGNLYAGGAFTTAGGVSANYIAKWDGTSWSPLGDGMNNSVSALAIDGEGNLIAGGDFTTAGGAVASRIARWDGIAWLPLGDGMNGTVRALASDGVGNVYADGDFTTAGGAGANRIARWDGTAWLPLGSGMGNDMVEIAWALAVDNAGDVYAGGDFTSAGGITVGRIATWDGTAWSCMGGGNGLNGDVNAWRSTVRAERMPVAISARFGGGRQPHRQMGRHGLVGPGQRHGWQYSRLGGRTTRQPVCRRRVQHGRRDKRQQYRQMGRHGVVGPGQRHEWPVRALAIDVEGNLYAGGLFTTADGIDVNGIAKWDGASGQPWAAAWVRTCSPWRSTTWATLYAGASSPWPVGWAPTASPNGTARRGRPWAAE